MNRFGRLLWAAMVRMLSGFLLLVGASFIIYITIRSAPGDAIDAISPMGTPPEIKQQLLADYGLDRDPITGYFTWLWHSLGGDFGESLVVASGEQVMTLIWPAFERTLMLSALALSASLCLALLLSLFSGGLAARGRALFAPLSVASTTPSFVVAILLSQAINMFVQRYVQQAGYVTPPWYPIPIGATGSVMPYFFAAITLIAGDGLFVDLLNTVRAELNALRSAQFIQAVRAKGARTTGHIARNMIVPLTSAFASRLPIVLGGVVIVEYIFTLEGAGYLLLEASRERDFPVVVGISVLFTATIIVSSILADLIRSAVDPREVARGG